MTPLRLSWLETSMVFALLSIGYQMAFMCGRKWSFVVRNSSIAGKEDDRIVEIFKPSHNSISASARKERMERLLQTDDVATGTLANHSSTIVAAALLHPALLAHPRPHHIVLWTNSTDDKLLESYVDQALQHKNVHKITIWNLHHQQQHQVTCEKIVATRGNERQISSLHHWPDCPSRPSVQVEQGSNSVPSTDIDILFIDSSVSVSPHNLTNLIQGSALDDNHNFMLLVELKHRVNIPSWVQALKDWDTMTDFTIRLPLPPPRALQQRHYVVAFPDSRLLAHWHLNEAEWNRKILDKLSDNRESFALDSALMSQFAYPSKHSEVEFCNTNPDHVACQTGGSGFDPFKQNVQVDQLRVQRSLQGEHSGRGVFTKIDIPANSYIGIDVAVLRLPWTSTELITNFTQKGIDIYEWEHDTLYAYFEGYGFVREPWGMPHYDVDATKVTFVNHGCHGSNNVGLISPHHESNLERPPWDDEDHLWASIPSEFLVLELDDQLYLPIRNPGHVLSTESNQFIPAGQEILDNYLIFAGTGGLDFWENVQSLRQECRGMAGFIQAWETMYGEETLHRQQNFTVTLVAAECDDNRLL